MKVSYFGAMAVAAAATAFASSASATPITVAFNVVSFGTFTADTGDITNANTITSGAPSVVGAIVTNNIGLVAGQPVTLFSPMGVNLGDMFSKEFTTPLGTFLETLTVVARTPGTNSLGILAQGTISQTVGTGFDPTPVFWSAGYTQNQGPDGQINASFNNSTPAPVPPPSIPEPSTLALLGLAMAGLGLSRRRHPV